MSQEGFDSSVRFQTFVTKFEMNYKNDKVSFSANSHPFPPICHKANMHLYQAR